MYSDGAFLLVMRFQVNELYIIQITPIWPSYVAFMASMADLLFFDFRFNFGDLSLFLFSWKRKVYNELRFSFALKTFQNCHYFPVNFAIFPWQRAAKVLCIY